MAMMSYGEYGAKPGVVTVGKQDTEHVAAEALTPQTGDAIWKPYEPAEVDKIRSRLDEIRGEIGQLYADLYPPHDDSHVYKQPEYKRQAEIRPRIDDLETEERGLQAYLREVYPAMHDGLMAGAPFGGTASKIVGEDKTLPVRQEK